MGCGDDIHLRPLTADERRGYDLALDQVETWAGQLERHAADLPKIEQPATLNTQLKNSAGLARAIAQALRVGFPPPPPPAA